MRRVAWFIEIYQPFVHENLKRLALENVDYRAYLEFSTWGHGKQPVFDRSGGSPEIDLLPALNGGACRAPGQAPFASAFRRR